MTLKRFDFLIDAIANGNDDKDYDRSDNHSNHYSSELIDLFTHVHWFSYQPCYQHIMIFVAIFTHPYYFLICRSLWERWMAETTNMISVLKIKPSIMAWSIIMIRYTLLSFVQLKKKSEQNFGTNFIHCIALINSFMMEAVIIWFLYDNGHERVNSSIFFGI